jgi:hypothetical protein
MRRKIMKESHHLFHIIKDGKAWSQLPLRYPKAAHGGTATLSSNDKQHCR